LYRHQAKPYHIDYCFASGDWMAKLAAVEVGHFRTWKKYSDHVPLMVRFEPLTVGCGPKFDDRTPRSEGANQQKSCSHRPTANGQRPFLL
jgi:hypothetical protein